MPILLALALLVSNLDEQKAIQRVRSHLLIEDTSSALRDASEYAQCCPESLPVQKVYIEALAAQGKEEKALIAWEKIAAKEPEILYERPLLEELGWGVLKKGTGSTQYGVRLAATIGAYLTKDVRSIPIFLKMMRDSNAVIRSVAIQMASSYFDAPLKDEIARLFHEEKVWLVRLEVIKAIGILRMKGFEKELKKIVRSERSTMEEKHLACIALLEMYEKAPLEEMRSLFTSDRAGLRLLACMIALHFEIKEAKAALMQCTKDPNPDVRMAALNALGLFFRGEKKTIEEALEDLDPKVSITACWAGILAKSQKAFKKMEGYLFDATPEYRRFAAAALSATGKSGLKIAKKGMEKSQDPYVLLNLARGLIGQRVEVKKSSDAILRFLQEEKRMIMVDRRENPLFTIYAPSKVRYSDQIPNQPEAEDQMTRLHLATMLALVEDPRSPEAIRSFLRRKFWGVSGVAAATVLKEGDDTALEIVSELLKDEDPFLRLQAALVLAMFGKEEKALYPLMNSYYEVGHDQKLYILEAIGKIGNQACYSFLLSAMKEPFPILRVAAASALIQSVNR